MSVLETDPHISPMGALDVLYIVGAGGGPIYAKGGPM